MHIRLSQSLTCLVMTTTGKLFLDLFHHPLLLMAFASIASLVIPGGSSHPHALRLTRLIMVTWQLLLNLISYSLLLPPPTLPIILLSLCRTLVNTRLGHIN